MTTNVFVSYLIILFYLVSWCCILSAGKDKRVHWLSLGGIAVLEGVARLVGTACRLYGLSLVGVACACLTGQGVLPGVILLCCSLYWQ